MRETSLDASTGPYVKFQVARILIQAGSYDRALDLIEPLLGTPASDLTPAWLRLDPIFKPLKGNPRFDNLIAGKYPAPLLVHRRKRPQPRPRRNPRLELHDAHRRRQVEAPGSRAARIHHRDHLVHRREQRLVGVGGEDELGGGGPAVEVLGRGRAELVPVEQEEVEPLDPRLDHFGEAGPEIEAVGVAPDRGHRRDRLELGEQVELADVTGVEDPVHTLEHGEDLRPEEAVGVGDEAKTQGRREQVAGGRDRYIVAGDAVHRPGAATAPRSRNIRSAIAAMVSASRHAARSAASSPSRARRSASSLAAISSASRSTSGSRGSGVRGSLPMAPLPQKLRLVMLSANRSASEAAGSSGTGSRGASGYLPHQLRIAMAATLAK